MTSLVSSRAVALMAAALGLAATDMLSAQDASLPRRSRFDLVVEVGAYRGLTQLIDDPASGLNVQQTRGPLVSARARYWINQWLGLEAQLGYARSDLQVIDPASGASSLEKANVALGSIRATARGFTLGRKLMITGSLGIGTLARRGDFWGSGRVNNDMEFTGTVGATADLRLGGTAALQGGAELIFYRPNFTVDGIDQVASTQTDLALTLGATFSVVRFGTP